MTNGSTSLEAVRGMPASVDGLWPRVRIERWSDYQDKIEDFLDGNWLFRGVSSARYDLVPSVGRLINKLSFASSERDILDQFKRESLPLLHSRPVGDWEWLALAQHYGIPTRLLDWSESPYVSLFFAVWGNDDEDAGLYMVPRPEKVQSLGDDPFAVKDVAFFYPGYVTPRLVSQRGLFTIHPHPETSYKPDGTQQIVLDKKLKLECRRKLDTLGVHHAAMFSDLDGLSRRLVAAQSYRLQGLMPPGPPGPPEGGGGGAGAAAVGGVGAPIVEEPLKTKVNPRDPQKGQWGQRSERNGWSLTATVTEIQQDWYQTELFVRPAQDSRTPLSSEVVFHLHDTFRRPVRTVAAKNGKAKLKVFSYGAFTVGAEVKQDGTTLELDLSELESAPKRFREQ